MTEGGEQNREEKTDKHEHSMNKKKRPLSMKKKEILPLVGKLLSIASVIFIIYAIRKMGLDFSFVNNLPLFILVMVSGILLKLFSLWTSGAAWAQWLLFFADRPFEQKEARRVFIRANIGKYIPGNVMHFVQRNLFAVNLGISQVQLAVSTVFEVISYVPVALSVAVLTSWNSLRTVIAGYFGEKLPLLGIAAGCAAAAFIVLLIAFRKKIQTALKGYQPEKFIQTLVHVMLLQFLTLVLQGVILVLLIHYATGTITVETVRNVMSAYMIAWVLGYIVPGASGGMGIREMALLLLLGPSLGDSFILSLAVIHRLITTIGDFGGYLIVVCMKKIIPGENSKS